MQWLSKILKTELPGPRYWEGGGPAYSTIDATRELRQGEIISNLRYYDFQPSTGAPTEIDVHVILVPYAIVGTPDCDLLQEFKNPSDKIIGVLLFPLEEFEIARQRTRGNSNQWRWVRSNQVSQFYRLTEVAAAHDALSVGMPVLIVDFKRYFTLSPREIYRQCGLGQADGASRRCRLTDVWREDFRQRALSYMGRVAVPGEDE